MIFDDKDKNFGCLVIVAAFVASVIVGGALDTGQRVIKKALKIEQPLDSANLAKQQAAQIRAPRKIIRTMRTR